MEFEGRSRIRAHLDIAPLIDIVFLLLVFFMLTSTFLFTEAIDLELPEAGSASVAPPSPVSISIDRQGTIHLDGVVVPLGRLRSRVAVLIEQTPELPVILKSDARTEVQRLIEVMDEIRAAGGSNIALAAQPE